MPDFDTNTLSRPLTVFEKKLADQFAAQGFENKLSAYLALRPKVKPTTASAQSVIVLKRPHVKEYLHSLQVPAVAEGKAINRQALIEDASRITKKAEDGAQYTAALKGVELQGRFIGAFDQGDDDERMYMQFLQNVTININPAPEHGQVIDHE